MSAATEATTAPLSPARAEAQRILREVEDLREVRRISVATFHRIEVLLSHDLSRMQAVRGLVQGTLADVQRLAPEVQA